MKSLKIYYNSACSKCRQTHSLLTEAKVPFEIVEYLKTPPTPAELEDLLGQLGMAPEQLVRKGEEEYEALESSGRLPATRQAWIEWMVSNPIVIERPIVSDGRSAVVARPPERVSEWLKNRSGGH